MRTSLSTTSTLAFVVVALASFLTACGKSGVGVPASEATGFATPEEAVDAYIKAVKAADAATFKKLVARSEKFMADFKTLFDAWKALDAVKTEDEGWTKLLTQFVGGGQKWADGPHKKFPAEIKGDEATVIGVGQQAAGQEPHYVFYKLTKFDGKWYFTEFGGMEKEKLDMTKYGWTPPEAGKTE